VILLELLLSSSCIPQCFAHSHFYSVCTSAKFTATDYCAHELPAVWQQGAFRVCPGTSSLSCCFRMDQAPKDTGLGAQASFDSLNGDSDDDAFSEVTGISRRSMSGWGSFAGLQGAERNVSRFFRRFIPSHTTAQTGKTSPFPLLSCLMLPFTLSHPGHTTCYCS
jgi:hypothetical protein